MNSKDINKNFKENGLCDRFSISYHGSLSILKNNLVGFICPLKASGETIIKVYDVSRKLRDRQIPTIGIFENRLEREAFKFLIRGTQPIVIVTDKVDLFLSLQESQNGISLGQLLIFEIKRKSAKHSPVTRFDLIEIVLSMSIENLIFFDKEEPVVRQHIIQFLE